MKSFLASLIAVSALFVTSTSSAIFGGPFDNGFHHNLSGGTYTVVYQMTNGNGLMRFSQDTSFTDGNGSNFSVDSQGTFSSVFYRGIVYAGQSGYGFVDADSEVAAGTSVGTAGGQITTADGTGTAGNIGTCAVNWNAEITDNGYNLRFKGNGVAHFYGDLDTFTTDTTTNYDLTQTNFLETIVTGEVVDGGVITITPPLTSVTDAVPPTDTIEETTTIVTPTDTGITPDPLTSGDLHLSSDAADTDGDGLLDTGTVTVVTVEVIENQPFQTVTTVTENGTSVTREGSVTTNTTTDVYDLSTGPGLDLATDPDNIDLTGFTPDSSSTTSETRSVTGSFDPGSPSRSFVVRPAVTTESATTITPATSVTNGDGSTTENRSTDTAGQFDSSGGEATDFDDVGHRIQIKVYGSRTSWFLNATSPGQ